MGIEESEVEAWVVHGIGKKLLDARINQLSRSVAVTRTTHCSFGTAQWQELSAQLSQWAVRPLLHTDAAVIAAQMTFLQMACWL